MKEYKLSDKYIAKTVIKGTQVKYYKQGYYYKLGRHEAICEDLATKVLSHSTLDSNSYVSYEKCIVNGNMACRSYTFLDEGETFLTINSLYEK